MGVVFFGLLREIGPDLGHLFFSSHYVSPCGRTNTSQDLSVPGIEFVNPMTSYQNILDLLRQWSNETHTTVTPLGFSVHLNSNPDGTNSR
jgi:hypothetical protein